MRNNKNEITIAGYVYQNDNDERRALKMNKVQKETSPNYGKVFISGTIHIAVDEEGLNVIPVHFTYIAEKTKAGKDSATFKLLKKIIDHPEDTCWIECGKDNALRVKIIGHIAVNDFLSNRTNEIVSSLVIEGNFVNEQRGEFDEKKRNVFEVDMLINKINRIEADPEANVEKDYMRVSGAVFSFRNEMLPVTFVCYNEKGMEYLEDMDISVSNPLYTVARGKIDCRTVKSEKVVETAWGEPDIQTREYQRREWVLESTGKVPYEFGEEDVMTSDELKKMIQEREVHLAEVRTRAEERNTEKEESAPKIEPKADVDWDF